MWCTASARRWTFKLVEDRLRRRGPDEGGVRGIVLCDDGPIRPDELSDAAERVALDGRSADEAEPAFRLIEP